MKAADVEIRPPNTGATAVVPINRVQMAICSCFHENREGMATANPSPVKVSSMIVRVVEY